MSSEPDLARRMNGKTGNGTHFILSLSAEDDASIAKWSPALDLLSIAEVRFQIVRCVSKEWSLAAAKVFNEIRVAPTDQASSSNASFQKALLTGSY